MILFEPTTRWHIEMILPRLRAAEQRSIEKWGIDARALLEGTLERGMPSYTALVGTVPACMWGLEGGTLLGHYGLWMLTTDLVDEHPVTFLRNSRRFVEWAREHYGPLDGMVDAEYELSERWLRWIGFRQIEDGPVKRMRYG